MPTGIYDSSLITHRQRIKAESGSFINRIQNPVNPNTGYAPALGIYDQSIINSVNTGQMKFFRKNDGGCTIISTGCPCSESNAQAISAPGEIPFIIVRYGSVIVEWGTPSGTPPFNYIVYGLVSGVPTVQSPIITQNQYSFSTLQLVPGTNYDFKVVASNGAGTSNKETTETIVAPYGPPAITATLNGSTPGSIFLSINSSPFTLTSSSEYNIITFLNGVPTPATEWTTVPSASLPIVLTRSNLLGSKQYSFKVQLKNSATVLSSYSNQTVNILPVPSGPQSISWSALTSTSIRVTYNNFFTQAGGFNLIGAVAIVTNGYSFYLNTTNLTNTSVDIIGLNPATTYYDFTLQFQSEGVNSLTGAIPTFTTLP
jgi:hypothetical protein